MKKVQFVGLDARADFEGHRLWILTHGACSSLEPPRSQKVSAITVRMSESARNGRQIAARGSESMLPRLWMSGPFLTVRRRRTVPPVNLLMEFDLSVHKAPV